jgi:hypothetical protein
MRFVIRTVVRVVILVPYRSDGGGRRDQLWAFVKAWLEEHHPDWPIVVGESPEGPFNRGAAVNDAARRAGDWDAAIIHDADNIADPVMLRQAVKRTHETRGCVFPFATYLYLDEYSTNRLLAEGNCFLCPIEHWWGVIPKHHSGIQAISRTAYDQVGGLPELEGWGYEDSIMSAMLKAFTNGIEHLQGGAYHLYHGDSTDPERKIYGSINRQVLADVMALSMLPDQLREYLRAGGHPI